MSVIDRINSTSSSNESVCSTSSLNHSYSRQTQSAQQTAPSKQQSQSQLTSQQVPKTIPNYLEFNSKSSNYTSIRDETSQNLMPKKTQRTKEFARQRFHSPRDNV